MSENKVTNQLLITVQIHSEKYREYLSDSETVRGANSTITVNIKNVGTHAFLGGEAQFICSQLGTLAGPSYAVSIDPFPIPTIDPGKDHISSRNFRPISMGVHRIKLTIQPNENVEIEYFQQENGPPSKENWITFLFTVRARAREWLWG